MLKVENLYKTYSLEKSFLKKNKLILKALNSISFDIKENTTLAIIGESGCGKSTLAKILVGVEDADSGSMVYKNSVLDSLHNRSINTIKDIQIVFQNPYSSLNPRQTIFEIVSEPLVIHANFSKNERRNKVIEVLSKVDLHEAMIDYYPHMLSGGQRQRVSIARSIILDPKLIILDEPVSALDISVQAQVLNLLKDLKDELNLTYLFISHDISVVNCFADELMVMYLGRIVESGQTQTVINNPQHPYTKALVQSSLTIEAYNQKQLPALSGELPSPLDLPKGCPFVNRCPVKIEKCSQEFPKTIKCENGSTVSCFLAKESA